MQDVNTDWLLRKMFSATKILFAKFWGTKHQTRMQIYVLDFITEEDEEGKR